MYLERWGKGCAQYSWGSPSGFGGAEGTVEACLWNRATQGLHAWLSKLWSPFGSPKYWVPYYTRTQKGTIILTTSHIQDNVRV